MGTGAALSSRRWGGAGGTGLVAPGGEGGFLPVGHRPRQRTSWALWGRRRLPAFVLSAPGESLGALGQRRRRGGAAVNWWSEAAEVAGPWVVAQGRPAAGGDLLGGPAAFPAESSRRVSLWQRLGCGRWLVSRGASVAVYSAGSSSLFPVRRNFAG